MKNLVVHRFGLSVGVATAMLAGCGGSQPPIGAPGAMPQSHAVVQHAARGKSWMLPQAKRGDLLYVSGGSDAYGDGVAVYTYPNLKAAGALQVGSITLGLCTDAHGDVFVLVYDGSSGGKVYEYAHGGTKPIETLDSFGAIGCSVDQSTGNLALTSAPCSGYVGVAIYQNAKGDRTVYCDGAGAQPFVFAAYDNLGNLFLSDNQELTELTPGSGAFTDITLSEKTYPFSLQWFENKLIVASDGGGRRGPEYVYQVEISGSYGTVVHKTLLKSHPDKNVAGTSQFWIQGNRIIGGGPKYDCEIWQYPRGGHRLRVIHRDLTAGVVVSAAAAD